MDMARRRTGAEAFRRRERSVHGRAAPRDRHRRAHGCRGALGGDRRRRLCGAAAARGVVPDCAHRGRLLGHARPPGLDRASSGDVGLGGRRRGDDRPQRRRGGSRALCPFGHPPDGRPQRLPRPGVAAPGPTSCSRASGRAPGSGSSCTARGRARAGDPEDSEGDPWATGPEAAEVSLCTGSATACSRSVAECDASPERLYSEGARSSGCHRAARTKACRCSCTRIGPRQGPGFRSIDPRAGARDRSSSVATLARSGRSRGRSRARGAGLVARFPAPGAAKACPYH